MAQDSPIQWCDSSLNLQMGCDGCELWNGTVKKCYAGIQTQNKRGAKGWPDDFSIPKLFPERLDPALKWSDLTGTERPAKPWLNGMPRLIFLNEMGDTFSKKLPLDWLAPFLPKMAASPHQFLLLTKRPSRLLEFSIMAELPKNIWPGTTVTSEKTVNRIFQLSEVRGGGPKFVSFEPLWSDIPASAYYAFDWAIFGGESGREPTPTNLAHIANGIERSRAEGIRPFVKQLGAKPYLHEAASVHVERPGFRLHMASATLDTTFALSDSHGGDWNEWPANLRVREMPPVAVLSHELF